MELTKELEVFLLNQETRMMFSEAGQHFDEAADRLFDAGNLEASLELRQMADEAYSIARALREETGD